jgi:hypothetical protein
LICRKSLNNITGIGEILNGVHGEFRISVFDGKVAKTSDLSEM